MNIAEQESASEFDLVLAIARDSEDALAEVYRRFGRALWATSRKFLGDDGLAEDIVQDVMVRLWDQPETFDPRRGSLRTFLLVLARNRCIDVLRSRRAQRRREQTHDVEIDLRASVEEQFDARSDVAGVARALNLLSAPQRQVIELAYFEGLTYRHIAKLLDLPEGTVKGRVRLALTRLRGAVTNEVSRPTDVIA